MAVTKFFWELHDAFRDPEMLLGAVSYSGEPRDSLWGRKMLWGARDTFGDPCSLSIDLPNTYTRLQLFNSICNPSFLVLREH